MQVAITGPKRNLEAPRTGGASYRAATWKCSLLQEAGWGASQGHPSGLEQVRSKMSLHILLYQEEEGPKNKPQRAWRCKCGVPGVSESIMRRTDSETLNLNNQPMKFSQWFQTKMQKQRKGRALLTVVIVKATHLCSTLCNHMDYTVSGILQARILEWVAFPFSRGSSQPRDWPRSPTLQADFFFYQLSHKGSPTPLTVACQLINEEGMIGNHYFATPVITTEGIL